MSAHLDTDHRWLVWRDRGFGDPYVFAAFDDRADAEALCGLDPRLTVHEHIAWLPTTTVRVLRGALAVRVGQMYPADDEILVCGKEPVGRGVVIEVGADEFAVAVPVLSPGVADGPSLWELSLASRHRADAHSALAPGGN
jgi:hypothetical protein